MKYFKVLLLIGLFVSCSSMTSNEMACNKINENLKIIHDFVYKIDPDSSLRRGVSALFFWRLTKIKVKDNYGFGGAITVTKEHYEIWKNWYEQRKDTITMEYLMNTVYRTDTVYNEHGDTIIIYFDSLDFREKK